MSMTMDQELVLTGNDEIEPGVKLTFEDGKGKRVRRVKLPRKHGEGEAGVGRRDSS